MLLAASLLLAAALAQGCDPRVTELVDLDGEHAWSFDAQRSKWVDESSRIRRQVRVAAGLWPMPPRGPVRAVSRGEIERGDYKVQRLLLETWPGFFLGANLYVPAKRDELAPGVLYAHGHWTDGRLCRRGDGEVASELASGAEKLEDSARFHLQAPCVQLARMGCFVLSYDMVGVADTQQFGHGEGFTDLDSLAWGESAFGLQTWNSLRALDWLVSVPGVDPHRLAMTGASGGGTQTFILCALDARVTTSFPAVMVSTGMQGGCICETAPHLRVGINNVAIAATMAPRPMALSGANDWTLHIEKRGLPELKAVYRALGDETLVAARCWPEYGHNYNLHARQMMESWFARHLEIGDGGAVLESAFTPIEPAELSALRPEGGLPPESRSADAIRRSLREAAAERFRAAIPTQRAQLDDYRMLIGNALEVLTHTSVREVGPCVAVRTQRASEEVLLLPSDGRPPVPATLLEPARANAVVCVAVSERGRGALEEPDNAAGLAVRVALDRGVTWLLPELLLADDEARGSSASLRVDAGRHADYHGYTWCYNRALVAERARDLLIAVEAARELEGVKRVVVWGEGRAGLGVLLASALASASNERPLDGVLADAAFDFDGICDAGDPDFLPGALRYGGLDGFAGLIAPTSLDLASREKAGAATTACFAAAGAPLNGSARPSVALVARWLERFE